MVKKQIRYMVVNEHNSVMEGFWQYSKQLGITIVCDDNEKYIGTVSKNEYSRVDSVDGETEIGKIADSNAAVIIYNDDDQMYAEGRRILSETNLEVLPVISKNGDILDVFGRERAFWLNSYREGTLNRQSYAILIYAAAVEAANLGIKGISVCEFGVAGGRGLFAAQNHAREISRLTGVDIQVFGFDLGTGLPQTDDPTNDLVHWFSPGTFDASRNEKRIKERLFDGNELILGDIRDTIGLFFDKSRYPVGAAFIDVDIYTSTKYILDWIKTHPEDELFLPRIFMYFDDVHGLLEGMGEHKALLEFNKEMVGVMRISPEGAGTISDLHTLDEIYGVYSKWLYSRHDTYPYGRIKLCHRFCDPRYNRNPYNDGVKDESRFKWLTMI